MPDELVFSKERQLRPVWVCRRNYNDCTRTNPCRPCLNARNARKGKRKQRMARKALGITPKFYGQGGNEETWGDERFRWEVKAGKQVQSLTARFLAAEAQSDAAHAIGDPRPFAFVAMPDGTSDGIVAVRLSVWRTLWGDE